MTRAIATCLACGLAWAAWALPGAAQAQALEAVTLRGGVAAVRGYAPGPAGTPDALSVLLLDAQLLSLVDPAAREAVDAATGDWRGRRALALVATALEPAELPLQALALRQGGQVVRPDAETFEPLRCEPARLPPDRACLALWWLPSTVRPDRPLRVMWFDSSMEIRFRR